MVEAGTAGLISCCKSLLPHCAGIALHTPGLIPYCATFFIFTDYMRGAMRMSALSEAGVIYVMTHDSIGLGEDGPTHQVHSRRSSLCGPGGLAGLAHNCICGG